MWELIFESALRAPWFGSGLAVPNDLSDIPGWSHPHNEFLRLFHQTGVVGLFLWLWFVRRTYRSLLEMIRVSKAYNVQDALVWHLTAIFMLTGFTISMFTDNSLSYSYVTLPLGIFLGLSMANRRARSSLFYIASRNNL